jgi:hypothetical protein
MHHYATPEGEHVMGQEYRNVTREELEKLAGEPLPERAAMSLINAQVAVPVNAAVAANVLTDHSTASSGAHQSGDIGQVAT